MDEALVGRVLRKTGIDVVVQEWMLPLPRDLQFRRRMVDLAGSFGVFLGDSLEKNIWEWIKIIKIDISRLYLDCLILPFLILFEPILSSQPAKIVEPVLDPSRRRAHQSCRWRS